ncbi:AAA family ATPase [Kutzneria sp. CA-103260]|uniref:AAA family ATPase n=1 Tax=Kutzneria sp. CA-103260 TaxID=2802641 RepID=UPI001BA87F1E|nr:AAA family ATPase [Kutzneria sp. CA-103260]
MTANLNNEDDPPSEHRGRRARVTWASGIVPEPVKWLWAPDDQGRIPVGSLCTPAGRQGTGKSSFGLWMCAELSKGTLPGCYKGMPRNVLYVAVEDSWTHTLVPRLIAAEADLNRVGRFDVVVDADIETTLSLPVDNRLLEEVIVENDVSLVVIDPLLSTIGAGIDTHREREVRSALDPLARIADRTGAVVLGVAHFNKGSSGDAASLITGSGAFKNVPRSVFAFARDDAAPQGGRVMTQVKNSLGQEGLPSLAYVIEEAKVPTAHGIAHTGKFRFTGKSERSVEDILQETRVGDLETRSERTEAEQWLLDYLDDNEAKAADVLKDAKADGIAESTLKRARFRLGVRSVRVGFGKGTVWSLDPLKPQSAHPDQPSDG